MNQGLLNRRPFRADLFIRRVFLSWMLSATISYAVLPVELQSLKSLDGLTHMSFPAVIIMTAIFFLALCLLDHYMRFRIPERWLILCVFGLLSILSLRHNFSISFLTICLLICLILLEYALFGWNSAAPKHHPSKEKRSPYLWITFALVIMFIVFVSIWTVCRVYSFSTPTYDFGIFSQMFYNMKTSGQPLTTLERDGLLSHFHVHVSPIYYLLLPFYCLVPTPATLQVLQAILLASAVIPLWKLGRHHGISPFGRMLFCALLLFYPAYSGGTSYDMHENAFLTPLILWLLYALDTRSIPLSIIFASLTLMVKEDAAVYVAVVGLYIFTRALLSRDYTRTWNIVAGIILLAASIVWFSIVTNYLNSTGDGVMTYRYNNFMYDGSGSLVTVVKAVILSPMKMLFECVDKEKLSFIVLTVLPLAGLPLYTRRFERLILLIPYILINLMSDYQYQHNIFFQYTFGSVAFLFYGSLLNLADMKVDWKRVAILATALCMCIFCFLQTVLPKAVNYPRYCDQNKDYYDQVRQTLSLIPEDATVSATTYYTTFLSQRDILYDVKYASLDHILSTDYVALAVNSQTNYTNYAVDGENGYQKFTDILVSNGYEVYAQADDYLIIYHKMQ